MFASRSVVVLLLPLRNADLFVDRHILAARAAARRGFRGGVAAVVAAADFLLRVEPLEHEVDGRRHGRRGRAAGDARALGQLADALYAARFGDHLVRRRAVAERQRSAEVEPFDDRPRVHALEASREDRADGGADEVAGDLLGAAQLALVLELELAGDRRQRRIEVRHARDDERFAAGERAPLRVRDDELERRDRQPLADARPLVDLPVAARPERELLDDLADVLGNLHLQRAGALGPRFLPRDLHAVVARGRVVRADFGSDAVLE